MKKIFLAALLLFCSHHAYTTVHAATIGSWKNYMAYYEINDVVKAGNLLYVLASNSLYCYNEKDGSITTYDKVNGLNGSDISSIGWNSSVKRLVIVYSNGNIDLLDSNGDIINISDYYNYSTTANKKINGMMMYGRFAYLNTGFGIVKLNVKDAEISESYKLGFNVIWSKIENNQFHAYSNTNGHYQAPLTANLLDKDSWSRTGDYAAETKENKDELMAKARSLKPGGPKYNYFYNLNFTNDRLYTVGGSYVTYNEKNLPGCVQVLDNNDNWIIYQDSLTKITGVNYQDNDCIAVDPNNSNHVFVGGKSGLYEFRNGQLYKLHTTDNSPLESAIDDGNKGYVIVESIKYDKEGNLWVLNSLSKTGGLLKYSKNGQWRSFNIPQLMKGERYLPGLQGLHFDKDNLLWIYNNHWNYPAVFCYQPSTGGINVINKFYNEDGTDVDIQYVRCLTEDKSGNIWFGTNRGPIMIKASEKTSESPTLYQVKVPRNDGTNLADYLLAGIDITCMVVDGGGRKWFGTADNGVYLISEDNMTQIEHFTETNSKLLSNSIYSVDINHATGEVFFGTTKGLCSYMSSVTEPVTEMGKVATYAYPNPVQPGYTGPITITGLTYNSDIKIVTVNGTLVNQGRSTGGSYVWDGNDLDGKRVASGVYMVEVAKQNGEKGTVTKIVVVN